MFGSSEKKIAALLWVQVIKTMYGQKVHDGSIGAVVVSGRRKREKKELEKMDYGEQIEGSNIQFIILYVLT